MNVWWNNCTGQYISVENGGNSHWSCPCIWGVPQSVFWSANHRFDNTTNWRPCLMPHGPLARYIKSRAAHVPGMPGTFPPPPRVSDTNMHHGTCVTHMPWCMSWSQTSGFLQWGSHGMERSTMASYQIRKIAGCACAGNAEDVFPATNFKWNC